MQKTKLILTLTLTSLVLAGCAGKSTDLKLTDQSGSSEGSQLSLPQEGPMKKLEDFEKIDAKSAVISTNKVELWPETAPVTVASFLNLSKDKFYDGIIVHRVEPGFVIQAGDPKTKEPGKEDEWGTGGPGYTIPDEFSDTFSYDQEGVLAMAKTMAPNSGGSQFFITLGPAEFLNGNYTPFGKVTKGMDVVKSIEVGDSIKTITYK
jgi:cyclophilin family peptidyl-prolyl cis-trans isomerase